MAKKRNKHPNMQRREKSDAPNPKVTMLLQNRGAEVAALAWAGYQQEGRGFVLVVFENDKIDLEYHGVNGDLLSETQIASLMPQLAEMLDGYDPKTEVVLSTAIGNIGELYTFGGFELPPPLAYAKFISNS